jgi:hypothetical protein
VRKQERMYLARLWPAACWRIAGHSTVISALERGPRGTAPIWAVSRIVAGCSLWRLL